MKRGMKKGNKPNEEEKEKRKKKKEKRKRKKILRPFFPIQTFRAAWGDVESYTCLLITN